MLILLVDDDEARRFVWRRWLEEAGHVVVHAATGREGLKAAGAFDVALIDVHLPDVSGTDVCSVLKQRNPATRAIVFSSVFTSPHEQADGLRGGADRYLAAPIDKDTLLKVVTSIMPHVPTR